MSIRDYFQKNLVGIEEGSYLLMFIKRSQFERNDYRGNEIGQYLMKWKGMDQTSFEGYSKDGDVAYPEFYGEILSLDKLSYPWSKKEILKPISTCDGHDISHAIIEEEPEKFYVGKDSILGCLEENGLSRYKGLLEYIL